jgi:hypothetical protein
MLRRHDLVSTASKLSDQTPYQSCFPRLLIPNHSNYWQNSLGHIAHHPNTIEIKTIKKDLPEATPASRKSTHTHEQQ